MALSEKILGGEAPEDAYMRGIVEEIGEAIHGEPGIPKTQQISIKPDTAKEWEEVTDSPSYPGLRSVYTLYQVDAHVSGLPTSGFQTTEYKHATRQQVKVHHVWEWYPTVEYGAVDRCKLATPEVQIKLLQKLFRGSQRATFTVLQAGEMRIFSLHECTWYALGLLRQPQACGVFS
jgi:hypothetical protein